MRKIIKFEESYTIKKTKKNMEYTVSERYYSDTYYTNEKENSLFKTVRKAIKRPNQKGIMTYEHGLTYEVFDDIDGNLIITDRKTAVILLSE